VLAQLSDFVNSGPHDYFATMLCVLIDVGANRLTVASAGHIPPLVIDSDGGRFVQFDANVPIGVARKSPYLETAVSVRPNTTLVAFTDGLVERRGEVLDVGLARLRDAATNATATNTAPPNTALPLEDLLIELAHGLASEDDHDDTAIVGVRWQS
jgi:serine phosphatase RsbU (regulator of sigma subunit)